MEKKKIILTSNSSYSLYNFRLGFMQTLKEKDFDVFVIAPEDEYTELLRKEFNFLPLKHLDRKGKNPLKDFMLFWEYLSYYRNLKPDSVINYTIKPNIYSSLACGVLNIPCISVITGLGYVFQKGGFLKLLVEGLYRVSFKFSKKIVLLNPNDLEELKKLLPKEKFVLIKSEGVNVSHFSPERCKEFIKERLQQKIVFLFLGRFLKAKGINELVEAGRLLWKERKDFEIWLVGNIDKGNPESLYEKDLEKIKTSEFVKILPFTKDVRPIICKSDCVVLPSYYREGIPRVLLEAMAMEKPIVTTDTPGCRETIFEEKNGFLVKPKNVESLYKAMKEFIDLPEKEREKMGKEGRKLVLKYFDEKLIIAQYMELIEEILKT